MDAIASEWKNSWNFVSEGIITISANDFLSLNVDLLVNSRYINGNLPITIFLRLKYNSDLIDKGSRSAGFA